MSMPKHVLNDQTRVIAQLVGKEDIDRLIDVGKVKLDEHGNVFEVYLASMGLTGQIPEAVGKWTSATKIDLSNNKLTGQIPDSSEDLYSCVAITRH